MRQIILIENDNNLEVKLEGEWNFADFMTIVLSALDGQVQGFIKESSNDLSEGQVYQLKGSVYDELNFLFGQILERIIPDGSETFDDKLTAEAILKAENDIIKAKYEKLKEEEDAKITN